MSYETKIAFKCDRCGKIEERGADRNSAEEELPRGWQRLQLKSSPEFPQETFELCNACRQAFKEFIRKGPARAGQP